MAQHKTKAKHIKDIVALIKKEELHEITYVCAEYGYTRAWFYDLGLDKVDAIREAMLKVRTDIKKKMLKHWKKDEAAPVLQISAFRLMADEDEHRKLTQKSIDHTTGGEKITSIEIIDPTKKKK